ncbi:MAG: hypothetical protein JSU07_02735 [Bacteroidetes bacterium]|nr:hypothetical protein [Bacteroidota bacterium]
MKKIYFFISVVIFIFFSCKKNTSPSGQVMYNFVSIKSDLDTISRGNVTNIKVNYTGQANVTWFASAGDIFGSGNNILFGASTCCIGNHTVTCTLKDQNNNSLSKSVVIYVRL